MTDNEANTAPEATISPANELRLRLSSMIGADRWVVGDYPTVAPISYDETSRLLKGYSGSIMVVGSGSSFPDDFNPGKDTLILLTNLMKEEFNISEADQTLTVSSGWRISQVNEQLKEAGFCVPSLARFKEGTVGGRLAGVSSRPTIDGVEGWIQWLLGLAVVLPSGEIIELGGRCIKDVAGYDLKHFFTGSRGVAGVIIRAVFRCRTFGEEGPLEEYDYPAGAAEYDLRWRRVFDPFGRMKPGY